MSARQHHVYSLLCASLGGDPLDRTTFMRLKRLRAGWPQILGASGLTPEQFPAFSRSEIEKWGRAVRASGAKPEG